MRGGDEGEAVCTASDIPVLPNVNVTIQSSIGSSGFKEGYAIFGMPFFTGRTD